MYIISPHGYNIYTITYRYIQQLLLNNKIYDRIKKRGNDIIMWTCTNCKHSNTNDAKYCNYCGSMRNTTQEQSTTTNTDTQITNNTSGWDNRTPQSNNLVLAWSICVPGLGYFLIRNTSKTIIILGSIILLLSQVGNVLQTLGHTTGLMSPPYIAMMLYGLIPALLASGLWLYQVIDCQKETREYNKELTGEPVYHLDMTHKLIYGIVTLFVAVFGIGGIFYYCLYLKLL